MKFYMSLASLLAVALVCVASGEQQLEQQRVLRRVIKSTPTANQLARVRLVAVRSTEKGAVAEISQKEAASFGQRSSNETTSTSSGAATKTKQAPTATTTTSTTTTSTSTTTAAPSTTAAPLAESSTTTSKPEQVKNKISERQQQAPGSPEVELLSSAPSSWQSMTAVEAPVAMLIATGARAPSKDLAQASSSEFATATGDFLRSSSTKGKASLTQDSIGETFARLRQHNKQQQTFFYPQQASKTSNYQATKTHWYKPSTTTTTSTTPRPEPLIQQERFEQQNEQYVEQQQQVEYGAAPLGQAEPFAFDFKTLDNSGNGQYRKEESDKNGVVRGSYGYTDASGIYRHVEYVADQDGFRANIKSNEPGLIGETQPASIQLAGGAAPVGASQKFSSTPASDNGEWQPEVNLSNSNQPSSNSADLALAPPDFESSHKSERLRAPRHYRN